MAWTRITFEGQMTIVACIFCGDELFRRRSVAIVESPELSASESGGALEAHMTQNHQDRILYDLASEWLK